MAGVVVRADILEDKDGKSRGIGTVTVEQSIEAVQDICILLWAFSSWQAAPWQALVYPSITTR